MTNGVNSNNWQFWSAPTDNETRNAPLKEPEVNPLQTNFQLPSPTTPKLDNEANLAQTLKYNQLGAQDALNTAKSSAQQTAQVAGQEYASKLRTDAGAALNASQVQTPLQQRQSNSFGGGGSYQGAGAFLDYIENLGSRGLQGNVSRPQAESNFRNQQNQALQSTALFGRANAEGNIYQAKQLANINNQSANQDQARQIDLMNRQASINSQNSGNEYLRLAQQNAQDRASRERVAATQAQATVFSSLLNSVGIGGSNYRYWG